MNPPETPVADTLVRETPATEIRTVGLGLLAACLATAAGSEAIASQAGESGVPSALLAIGLLLGGYTLLPRLGAVGRAPRLASGLMLLAFGLAMTPLLRGESLHGVGDGLHVWLVAALRNLVVVAAMFTRSASERRRSVHVGLLLIMLSFALSGSALVFTLTTCFALVWIVWLMLEEQGRWATAQPAATHANRPALTVWPTLTITAGMMALFAAGLVFYPSSIRAAEQYIARLAMGQPGRLRDQQRLRAARAQDQALQEIANRAYGTDASKNTQANSNRAADKLNAEEQQRKFSTIRNPAENQQITSEQLFSVLGRSAGHLPITQYAQFDGQSWTAEPIKIAPSQSVQLFEMLGDTDIDWSKLKPEDIKKIRGMLTLFARPEREWEFVDSGDFIGRARKRAQGWFSSPGGLPLAPRSHSLDDEQLLMLLGEPSYGYRSIPPEHLLTHYDLPAFAADALTNNELRNRLLQIGVLHGGDQQALRAEFERWRFTRRQSTLPPELMELAVEWVGAAPRGWPQVDALVKGLRQHAEHDPNATPPPGTTDSVRHFLIESRRGPDYLFASSAVVLLRGLNYPARMTGGFVAKPSRYRWWTGTTTIGEEDLHYWAQVRLGTGLWVDIEPTPGYEIAPPFPPPQPLWRVVLDKITENRFAFAIVAALVLVLLLARRHVVDAWVWTRWRLIPRSAEPARLAAATWRVVDRCNDRRGHPRPPHRTPARWYAEQLAPSVSEREAIERFGRFAERATYSPRGLDEQQAEQFRIDARCVVQAFSRHVVDKHRRQPPLSQSPSRER